MDTYHRYINADTLAAHQNLTYRSREPLITFFCDEEYELMELGYDIDEIEEMSKEEQFETILDSMEVDYESIDVEKEVVILPGWFAFRVDSHDSCIFDASAAEYEIVFEGERCSYPSSMCEFIIKPIKILQIIPLF